MSEEDGSSGATSICSVSIVLPSGLSLFWLPPPHRTLLERGWGKNEKEKAVQKGPGKEVPWGSRTQCLEVGGYGRHVQDEIAGTGWGARGAWAGPPGLTSIDLFSNLLHGQLPVSHVLPVQLHPQKPGGDSGHIKVGHLIVDIHPLLILSHHCALGVGVIVDGRVGCHLPQCCVFQAAQNILEKRRILDTQAL